jgi:pimeloyl-ACP methyl ester carboxylesterase
MKLINRRTRLSFVIASVLTLGFLNMNANAQVKNIVLVHGAFADGSGWQGVYKVLTARGYNVSIVGNPNTGMPDDVVATKRVLARQDGPVILVGHSYGGAIITEAGNESNVAGLVYVAAFAPEAGETLGAILQVGSHDANSGILPPEMGFVWYDAKKFHEGFCADLPAELAEFMCKAQVPIAASSFAYVFGAPAWKAKPVWYCVATEDRTIPPDTERSMAKRANAKITEIKGSHVIFISHPEKVADVIEAAAKGSAK